MKNPIKLLVTTTVFLFLFYSCEQADSIEQIPTTRTSSEKQVLFVGNSYTHYNDAPGIVQKMASSVQDTLIYEQHTPPGSFMSQHANSSELDEKIKSRKWDFVTLQTESQESALSQSHFDENVYPFAVTLVNKIRDNYSESMPLFFMTWGYENGVRSPRLCRELPYLCTFEGMNDILQERYTFFASSTNSTVSPCGVVWKYIRDKYSDDIDLYDRDQNHPSLLGSYVVATTFYTMIFQKDPTLVTYNDPSLDDSEEDIIKNAVKKVIFNNYRFYQF